MKHFKTILSLAIFLLLVVGVIAFLNLKSCNFQNPKEVVTTHSIVVEKIKGLGKMELLEFHFQDVVRHEIIQDWLPDPSVLLFAYGEAVGCIDFTQITQDDIRYLGDSVVYIHLPDPEICRSYLDHAKSKVLDTKYQLFSDVNLVDEAYQKAEKELFSAAVKAEIISKTKEKAQTVLGPMFGMFSGKKIYIDFEIDRMPND